MFRTKNKNTKKHIVDNGVPWTTAGWIMLLLPQFLICSFTNLLYYLLVHFISFSAQVLTFKTIFNWKVCLSIREGQAISRFCIHATEKTNGLHSDEYFFNPFAKTLTETNSKILLWLVLVDQRFSVLNSFILIVEVRSSGRKAMVRKKYELKHWQNWLSLVKRHNIL